MIADDEIHHGLHHRHGPGKDTGVVASARGEFGRLAGDGDSLLGLGDRGGRLERDAEEDVLAVADAALDAAGAIGGCMDRSLLDHEGVVVLASGLAGAGESAADLKSLGRGKTHHRLGEVGLQLVKDGFAESGWNAADDTLDDASDAVAL